MPTGKLPPEAFDFYVALGHGRSYAAVAREYDVTKRAVSKKAAAEDWQARLDRLMREASATAEANAMDEIVKRQMKHVVRLNEVHDAIHEVMTPRRVRALVAALFKAATTKADVAAGRLLLDRVLGRPRTEALPAAALDLPDGLQTTADVRTASNALMQAVAEGSIAPEDAQRAASVIEAARKSIETDDLEKRLSEIEEQVKKEGKRR